MALVGSQFTGSGVEKKTRYLRTKMKRAIITYAAGAHEELLDIALPTYKDFAQRHGYDLIIGEKMCSLPPAWNKIPLLLNTLEILKYDEVVWFDCDLVVVNPTEDFPPLLDNPSKLHAMVRHFEDNSEVPNSGVWRLRRGGEQLLQDTLGLEVFRNHGWWEQAALMTLMGYCVPPEGSVFSDTKCKCVYQTMWHTVCQFMRLKYNSHPNYRAEKPVIVHCSYQNMAKRLDVMRALVKDPAFDYPRYEVTVETKE